MGLSSQEKSSVGTTLFLRVSWYIELPPASCVPSPPWCPSSIRPFHGYASCGYLLWIQCLWFWKPTVWPSPLTSYPKTPFFSLCFSLFHQSNVFWQLLVLFQDRHPYLFMCVFVLTFLCVFSHKLPHITFLGQVENLEGCGKVTFGLWKEMELAPCTR